MPDPEIHDLLRPEHHNPHLRPLKPYVEPKAYDDLCEARVFLVDWTKDYGPVVCWPHALIVLRKEALESDEEDEWKEELKDKVRQGLMTLSGLRGLFIELPKSPWMIRDTWCQAFDLAGEIQQGIACIQAHLAMFGD
jgi:hypothetical protein